MTERTKGGRRSITTAQALLDLTERGGRRRKHRYWRDLRGFLAPALTVILAQVALYAFLTTLPGRDDWLNIIVAVAVLAFVPAVAGILLAAFRGNEAPIVSSGVVMLVLYSFAVSMLSAFRVPISYVAIAVCIPVGTVVMAYANIRFQRSMVVRVALAPFSQADDVLRQIGKNIPVLSGPDADLSDIDLLLIDPKAHHTEKWSGMLAQCYLGGVEIMSWTRYIEIWHGRLDVSSFDVSHLAYTYSQFLYAQTKRFLDLAVVVLTLPVSLTLAVFVAGYIWFRDGGPVLFVQLRRGFGGRSFRMYKFRTMYKGTAGGATREGDSRIIPGCDILRKLRLDELPQLYNVLRGEMSLIGPRPEAIDLARNYERDIPKYTARLLVLPGITGWAQVNYGYSGNSEEALSKLSYDLYYIKHLSFDLDALILFKTVATVLLSRGAR